MGCCVPTSDTATADAEARNAHSSFVGANGQRSVPQNTTNETEEMKSVKVIVMGNPSVGKTSIINSFI